MALRSWGRVLATAFAVALFTGAGQLGVAYGLGIVGFARNFQAAAEPQWSAHLAWVTWFAMLAAVIGAIAGEAVAYRRKLRLTLAGRAGLAIVAGLGALIVAPLSMQPARTAQLSLAIDPVLTVGLTAVLGALLGAFAAVAALSHRAIAWNVIVFAGGVWLLALVSVAPSLGPEDVPTGIRPGVLDLPSLSGRTTSTLALVGIPVLALLTGAATAGLARWLEHYPAAAAVSGAGGPALLAFAYLLAGPGDVPEQAAPYWGSIIGLAAGLLGSVLLAVVPRPGATPMRDGPRPGAGRLAIPNFEAPPDHADARHEPDTRHETGARHDPDTRRGPDTRRDPGGGDPASGHGTDPDHDASAGREATAGRIRPEPQRGQQPALGDGPGAGHEPDGGAPRERGLDREPGPGGSDPYWPAPTPTTLPETPPQPQPQPQPPSQPARAARRWRPRLPGMRRGASPAVPASTAGTADKDYVDWVAGLGDGDRGGAGVRAINPTGTEPGRRNSD